MLTAAYMGCSAQAKTPSVTRRCRVCHHLCTNSRPCSHVPQQKARRTRQGPTAPAHRAVLGAATVVLSHMRKNFGELPSWDARRARQIALQVIRMVNLRPISQPAELEWVDPACRTSKPRKIASGKDEEVDSEDTNHDNIVVVRCEVPPRRLFIPPSTPIRALNEAVDHCDTDNGRAKEEDRPDPNGLRGVTPPRVSQTPPDVNFVIAERVAQQRFTRHAHQARLVARRHAIRRHLSSCARLLAASNSRVCTDTPLARRVKGGGKRS